MPDVLLLHPAEQGKTFGSMPPLSMSWIVSFLQSKEISTVLADLQIDDRNVETLLRIYKPKVVGIGETSHTRFESFSLARRVKAYDSAIFTIYGGSHAFFTAADTLYFIPDIDIVVRGEGELSTYSVVYKILKENTDFSGIQGISYRQNGNIIHNLEVERIKDLDILPFPFRNPEAKEKYNLLLDFLEVPAASVISSRGCPINCSFCSASALFGTQLTFRSASNVVDEVEILIKEYGYQGIKFLTARLR